MITTWRNTLLLFVLSYLFVLKTFAADDSLVVITHIDTPIDTLSRQQIKNVYLGGPLGFESTPLMLSPSSELRQKFNTRVIGLSESRLRSYIAQMKFSGRPLPIEDVNDITAVIDIVSQRPGSIGYVHSSTPLPDNVKVIYRLGSE